MCHAVRCRTCGKTTWTGCGSHVAAVKATVPAGLWCPGHSKADRDAGSATPTGGGFLRRLRGR